MALPLYQVDAFTDRLYAGNPAAVVPLESWLDAETMQAIGAENNLSETAFLVPAENTDSEITGCGNADADFEIRWFTPAAEANLCGHATLASAFVPSSIGGSVLGDACVVLFCPHCSMQPQPLPNSPITAMKSLFDILFASQHDLDEQFLSI